MARLTTDAAGGRLFFSSNHRTTVGEGRVEARHVRPSLVGGGVA